jgi:hypothetical protein
VAQRVTPGATGAPRRRVGSGPTARELGACAALLLLLWVCAAGCESSAAPVFADAAARELGPDDFASDASADLGDALDAAEAPEEVALDADAPVGVGLPCLLLAPGCEAGLKCVPRFDGTGECRPVADPAAGAGEPCGRRGLDDCGAGHLCLSPDEVLGLRCFGVCDAATGAGCPEGVACSDRLPLLVETVGICF